MAEPPRTDPAETDPAAEQSPGEADAVTEAGPDSAVAGDAAPRRDVAATGPRRAVNTVAWALTGFLLVIVAAGAAYLSWPGWGPALPGWLRAGLAPVMEAGRNPGLTSRLSGLEARLASLETALAATRKSFTERSRTQALKPWAETAALNRRIAALRKELTALGADAAQRLAALESRPVAAPLPVAATPRPTASAGADAATAVALARLRADNRRLGDSVARLARRLAMLTAAPRAGGLSAAEGALMLAVGQLREALRGPAPFARELAVVRTLAGRDPVVADAMAALAPRADRGIPGRVMLRARFDRVARDIAQAALAPEGADWIDRTLQRLARLVTVRRVGVPAAGASGAGARLARAELRLAAGDLAGAVTALDGLTGAPADAARTWRDDASARIKADDAVAALTARAIAAFGGVPATAPAPDG